MDMAFLNGFMAAQRLPTQDTWLAGFGVPYYHFGYFVLACAAKLAGVAPCRYNLARAVPARSLAWPRWPGSLGGRRAAGLGSGGAKSSLFALACAFRRFSSSVYGGLRRRRGRRSASNALPRTSARRVTRQTATGGSASRVVPTCNPTASTSSRSSLLSDLHPARYALRCWCSGAAHVLSHRATLRSIWTQGLAALALGGSRSTRDIAPFWLLYFRLSVYAAWMLGGALALVAAVLPPWQARIPRRTVGTAGRRWVKHRHRRTPASRCWCFRLGDRHVGGAGPISSVVYGRAARLDRGQPGRGTWISGADPGPASWACSSRCWPRSCWRAWSSASGGGDGRRRGLFRYGDVAQSRTCFLTTCFARGRAVFSSRERVGAVGFGGDGLALIGTTARARWVVAASRRYFWLLGWCTCSAIFRGWRNADGAPDARA